MPLINFSGLATGIDSNALIQATSDASRAARIKPNEVKIQKLEDENTALDELDTKLTALQTIARNISSLNGGPLTKIVNSTDETIITGVASNAATNGSYTVNVTTKAKNATYSFRSTDFTYSSNTSTINPDITNGAAAANRTITVTIGTGSDVVTVAYVATNTSTLQDFADYVNNNSSSRAVATVVNAGTTASPDYRVVLTATNEGTAKGQLAVSVGSEITNATTAPNRDAFNNNTLDAAVDASFTITGLSGTITRSSNSVSDLIPGVTLNFVNTGQATVTVGDDSSATAAKVQEFVDKLNEIIKYVNDNNVITREEDGSRVENIFGDLASTRVDNNAITAIKNAIQSSIYSSGSQVKIFADVGITTERDGTLKFDSAVFKTALSNEPTSVNGLLRTFGDTVGATSGTIDQFTRFNGLLDLSRNGNKDLITDLNRRIADAEKAILKQEEIMRSRFSRLEGLVGQLQQQQNALSAALASLGTTIRR